MFSGQGSQYYQMGRGLYEAGGAFRWWMDRMDEWLIAGGRPSVVAALYGERRKGEPFVDTQVSHPAIFMVEVALARELMERGIQPDATIGASLGTFAAACIAGCLDVREALLCVARQADILQAHCPPGRMLAVLAHADIQREPPLRARCVVAAANFDAHCVLSMPADAVAEVVAFLRGRGITSQELPVAYAYHSPWIEAAGPPFLAAVAQLATRPAVLPLACSARATVLRSLPHDHFWAVAREPIRFQALVRELEAQPGGFRYLDVGPSGTLATFLKYLLPPASPSRWQATLTPFGRDLEALDALAAGDAG